MRVASRGQGASAYLVIRCSSEAASAWGAGKSTVSSVIGGFPRGSGRRLAPGETDQASCHKPPNLKDENYRLAALWSAPGGEVAGWLVQMIIIIIKKSSREFFIALGASPSWVTIHALGDAAPIGLPPMLRIACLLFFCLFHLHAGADQACRIAFDIGSSGIRVGSDQGSSTARADIDYLGDLWADRRIDTTLAATARAFRELPRQAGFPKGCRRVAGGFSAWRLAIELGSRREMAVTLAKLHRRTGVAVLVIPQRAEGRYGYVAAQRRLGNGLRTSHIVDIGGGSLQVAGSVSAWGRPLGQKAWNKLLCEQLRPGDTGACALPAMSDEELGQARRLLAERLRDLAADLHGPVSLTAISRPVSRGIYPALQRLAADGALPAGTVDGQGFNHDAVQAAIARLAPLDVDERSAQTGVRQPFSAYLLSDLILVEGILLATGASRLEVAELDLTNVPGLLADERAFAWARHYACYLDRLRRLGEAAYDADPSACRR